MSGKLVGIFLLICGAVAGGGLYYLQIYGFYEEVAETDGPDVRLILQGSDAEQAISYSNFRAVDADSSPIRFRACFETTETLEVLSAAYVDAGEVIPRNAPGWFECFNATALAQELKDGTARAYLGQKNIRYGVDRIVAVTDDGRGYIWHELNECGDKAYDGTVVGEECPPLPEQNG